MGKSSAITSSPAPSKSILSAKAAIFDGSTAAIPESELAFTELETAFIPFSKSGRYFLSLVFPKAEIAAA